MDNLIVYKNKGETFKCHFNIDGAEIKDTFVRLCLEFNNNKNMFFYGNLDKNGDCIIEIPKLKEVQEKDGKLAIEAIADSVYFKLYEANVELKNSVEVSITSPLPTKESTQPAIQLSDISQLKKSIKENKEQPKKNWPRSIKDFEIKSEENNPKDEWQPLKEETQPPVYQRVAETEPKKFVSLKDYMKKKES